MTSIESPASAKGGIRVVLDANVLISAAVAGLQAEYVLTLISRGTLHGFTSIGILDEVHRKLTTKFHRTEHQYQEFERAVLKVVQTVDAAQVTEPRLRDPGDLHVLGTAIAAKADLLITTDRDLLTLKRFKAIAIIHPKTLRWTFPSS